MSRRDSNQQTSSGTYLYQIVFYSRSSKLLVTLIFAVLLLQPVGSAFAAEELVGDVDTEDEIVEVEEVDSGSAEDLNIDTQVEDDVFASNEETVEETNEEKVEKTENVVPIKPVVKATTKATSSNKGTSTPVVEISSEQSTEPIATSTNSIVDTESGNTKSTTTASTTEIITETHSSSTPANDLDDESVEEEQNDTVTSEDVNDENSNETSSTTEVVIEDDTVDQESSTTSENVAEPGTEVVTKVGDDNPLHFNTSECTQVAGGSYYCEKRTTKSGLYEQDEIFSAPDTDGDAEIFIRLNGKETQITNNKVDDKAPQFDATSDTIVWHRLIEGRYQIISYDYTKGTETQLTTGNQNHMEPSIYGSNIAWQVWDGTDWEVVLFDGKVATSISNNALPDIAPRINENFVIWNTIHNNGEKGVVVYNIETKQKELIQDTDGGMVKNARFVLVYDTEFENGDIVTRGFDPKTGKISPLSAVPGDLPKDLPPVDQTGETRALINNKSIGREGEVIEEPDINPNLKSTSTPPVIPVATSTPTTTAPTDLVLPKDPTASSSIEVIDSSHGDGRQQIPDVVIPPRSSSSSTEVG